MAASPALGAIAATTQLNAKQQAYKKLADTRSAQTAEGPMKLLGQNTFEIDLSSTPAFQMECLLKVLHAVPSFQTVRIQNSEKSHKPAFARRAAADAQKSKTDGNRRPSANNAESDALKMLVPSLARNRHLVTLELDSLPATLVKRIPNMMKGSMSALKHLLIRNVVVDDPNLTKLMQTIASSQIFHLELVNCGLGETCGRELKEIISIHNIRRDVAKWQDKLRDQDNFSNSSFMGLLHIDLSKNHLQDSAIRPIIEALVDDKWVKSLDLSSNSLSNSIIGEFIDLLKVNSSLTDIIVRDNHDLDNGMVALLQTTLAQRRNDTHGVVSTNSSTESDIYPARRMDKRSSPKKVEIPSAKTIKAVPTSELIKSLEKLFQNQAGSADGFTREQFREVVNGVQKLTDLLTKTQEQLKQVTAENSDLVAEMQRRAQKQPRSASGRPRPKVTKRRQKRMFPDSVKEPEHLISDQDLDDIVEVIDMFESIFSQLHTYMDSMQESASSTTQAVGSEQSLADISEQVRKSAAMFEHVASKLQSRSQP